MLDFGLSFGLASEDGHVSNSWLLLYMITNIMVLGLINRIQDPYVSVVWGPLKLTLVSRKRCCEYL